MPGFSGLSNQAFDRKGRLARGSFATIAQIPFRAGFCMTYRDASIHRPRRAGRQTA